MPPLVSVPTTESRASPEAKDGVVRAVRCSFPLDLRDPFSAAAYESGSFR